LLELHRVEAGALYSPPCHLMPVFRTLLGTGPGTLPKAERLLPRQICLPMHSMLRREDADRSVDALDRVLRRVG
jgi:dTDP-4-amino-4,6-dideoxygalactose transaminase